MVAVAGQTNLQLRIFDMVALLHAKTYVAIVFSSFFKIGSFIVCYRRLSIIVVRFLSMLVVSSSS
jgi:hypothetical protein